MLVLDLAVEAHGWAELPPNWAEPAVRAAFAAAQLGALATGQTSVELSVRLTSDADVQLLNRDYRGKDKPTNVLSFPLADPDSIDAVAADPGARRPDLLLGDVVMAFETVAMEAQTQGKSLHAHATHLLVHGTLHVLGYDHEQDDEAEAMEALERSALASLGIADPY
jgi:probable rRNA maturation factor